MLRWDFTLITVIIYYMMNKGIKNNHNNNNHNHNCIETWSLTSDPSNLKTNNHYGLFNY